MSKDAFVKSPNEDKGPFVGRSLAGNVVFPDFIKSDADKYWR